MRNILLKVVLAAAAVIIIGVLVSSQLGSVGANMLLTRNRRHVAGPAPETCQDATFTGVEVRLKGWRCRASMPRRGTIIYLHGIGSNRTAGTGVIQKFTTRGFEVIAYDSRGHGESDGKFATYGFYEKEDLRRIVDTLPPEESIVLIGTSFGAAVSLQAAAEDRRIRTVIAAESFADLRSVARHRAPRYFVEPLFERALRIAEERARFSVDAVDVVRAAARITAPVLLIHGADDPDTPPSHSQRIFDALTGPKRLVLVPHARHNQSVSNSWQEMESWLDAHVTSTER